MNTTESKNEHGAGQFPHEGGCAECRRLMQCNACGARIYAGLASQLSRSARCTNGRCTDCHHKFCTTGGSPGHRGHGYWRKGTKPDRRMNCDGSGQDPVNGGGFAGELDECPACGKWVMVKRDGRLRVHRGKVEEGR